MTGGAYGVTQMAGDRIPEPENTTPQPSWLAGFSHAPEASVSRSMNRPVTAKQAVDICESMGYLITVGQIRQWANRGLIKKLGMDQFNAAMRYDLVGILARVMADRAA